MIFSASFLSTSILSYGVIFLAEMGDKSQLVCMALAAKHRAKPVVIGAVVAFSLLNLLAVIFGGSLSQFIPQQYLTVIAAILFIGFGCHSLFAKKQEEDEKHQTVKSARGIVLTTFLMIFLAELADKTQLAVMTMSTTTNPIYIWLGATLALVSTSLMGVYAGRRMTSLMKNHYVEKLSGIAFIAVGLVLSISQFI